MGPPFFVVARRFQNRYAQKANMIHVIATIELVSGTKERFLAEFKANVPAVLREAGCLEYGPTIDFQSGLPAQNSVGPNVVVVVEKWSDLNALNAHLQAPHMIAYRTRVKDFVVHMGLQVLQSA